MRLAQYFAGIFHNIQPNIPRPFIFRGHPYFAALSPQYLPARAISLHARAISLPAWASLYNARPRYLDKRPSLRNIFLHESSLYNARPRYLYKRPSLRNIFLHGSSLSLHEPSLYNARPRYLDKRPSN